MGSQTKYDSLWLKHWVKYFLSKNRLNLRTHHAIVMKKVAKNELNEVKTTVIFRGKSANWLDGGQKF